MTNIPSAKMGIVEWFPETQQGQLKEKAQMKTR